MKMNKVWPIVRFNLEKDIRNKWFIALNVLLFVFMVIGMNFSHITEFLKKANISKTQEYTLNVYDETGIAFEKFEKLKRYEKFKDFNINKIEDKSYDENLDKNTIIILVLEDEEKYINAKVISKEGIDTKYYNDITDILNEVKSEIFAKNNNIELSKVESLKEDVVIDRIMLSVDANQSENKALIVQVINYIIFFVLIMVLSKVANDVSQEKISKSIEYVLTCISEKEYLIAKIISINLTIIMQVIFTVIYYYISVSISSLFSSMQSVKLQNEILSMSNYNFTPTMSVIGIIFVSLVLMVVSVIIMCYIQAALSSRTTNLTEANNSTLILLTINMVIYFMVAFLISPLKKPSTFIYIISCLPIFSTYFIPVMMYTSHAKLIQIIIAIVLDIIFVPLVLKISSKEFKKGVLGYTKATKGTNTKKKFNFIDNLLEKQDITKFAFALGMSIILYITSSLLFSIISSPIISILQSKLTNISATNLNLIINIIIFGVTLYIPYRFILGYGKESKMFNKFKGMTKKKIKVKNTIKVVLMSLPILVLVQVLSNYVLNLFNYNYNILDNTLVYDKNSIFSSILVFIYISIMPAIFEELFFRKGIIKAASKIGNKFAIIISAVVFSLLHLNFGQSFGALFIGILFGIVAVYTDSILPTVILHLLNNGSAMIFEIFENNNLILNIFNALEFALLLIGVLLIITEVIKNRKEIKKKISELKVKKKNENTKNNYLYLFLDYVFIVAFILVIVMFVSVEKLLIS